MTVLKIPETIVIDRTSRGGAYAVVVDVCHRLKPDHGSMVNALFAMIQESPTFQKTLVAIEQEAATKVFTDPLE